ncbi:MAG: 2-octaprenyl-3-methyl-6-methoxy-1,4-benzoquinol hydroxylase [Sphingobacteriia bacterium]|nr:2-octaprenyl-3-methyl-6-methoxy-1,4-benzoquinol hydroxylase [Sphingobacteriia bacterium]NCC39248.1 2-octaprenyl-3-methyl-6-methoxy-1,4-benzoquinol hydroxylase [Gammaproteobacteria bacterium]
MSHHPHQDESTTPASAPPHYDLILVGGGMVGATLARACAGKGLRIALIETRAPQRHWPAGEIDLRVSALNRASQRILGRLGVWSRILALGASPYRQMCVWDGVGGGTLRFDAAALGEPDLGHIVENRVIQLALWEALERCPDVTLWCPAAIAELTHTPSGSHLLLTDGRALSGRLLIAADGRDSLIRQLVGIETEGWEYDQRAIVATVQPSQWHQETAWQRFLPTGPVALLPLANGHCSIVWSATEARAAELLAMTDADFAAALTEATESRLGPLELRSPRAAIALRLQHAKQYVLPGLALVGDAAHAVHPLAGQGVNLGLLDAAALVDAIDRALAHGRDLGGLWALRHYERARRGDNLVMLTAMDLLKRLFSNALPPLAGARSLGLTLTDHLAPLKQVFMMHALGLRGDLPRLTRVGH